MIKNSNCKKITLFSLGFIFLFILGYQQVDASYVYGYLRDYSTGNGYGGHTIYLFDCGLLPEPYWNANCSDGINIATYSTESSGYYRFDGLADSPHLYRVKYWPPSGWVGVTDTSIRFDGVPRQYDFWMYPICSSGYGNSCSSSNACYTNYGSIQCNGSCSATTPPACPAPTVSSVSINSSTVNPNNSNQYNITVSGTDPGGASNITHLYALVNYQGSYGGYYRGFVTWYGLSNAWPGYQDHRHCSGVGSHAVVQPGYGDTYIHLDGCNISDSGNTRTATFTVRFAPSFTSPVTNNDISGYVHNIYGNNTGWVNFDTNFSLTFTPPAVPTISGPISGYPSTNYTYSFNSTDPSGYQIRYGIDWDLNGVADEWLPAGVSYVNSGVTQSTSHGWSSVGTKQFKALTQNYQGTNSSWSNPYSVSIINVPITGVCGTRNTNYQAGTSGWPEGSTYCSAGTPSSQPSFPSPGQSVTWTCLGSNGGSNSPLCTATSIQTKYSLTTYKTAGGKVESADNVIKCGNNCVNDYNEGSAVTLYAVPSSSYWRFVQWSGDCSGTNPVCVLSVNGPKIVTAIFSLRRFNYGEF